MNAPPRAALALLVLASGLCGCQTALHWPDERKPRVKTAPPVAGVHRVAPGETLYAIALRYSLPATDLAAWNGLGNGELIVPGQRFVLKPPPGFKRVPSPPVGSGIALGEWLWPATGTLASTDASDTRVAKGIDIKGKMNAPIFAAGDGRVVYAGGGLIGYGQLIIVKHSERVLSAYGYNRELLVREGDRVVPGQRIATMGTGPGRRPLLHFEIRIDGKPVDPLKYLPQRAAR